MSALPRRGAKNAFPKDRNDRSCEQIRAASRRWTRVLPAKIVKSLQCGIACHFSRVFSEDNIGDVLVCAMAREDGVNDGEALVLQHRRHETFLQVKKKARTVNAKL